MPQNPNRALLRKLVRPDLKKVFTFINPSMVAIEKLVIP